MLTVGGKCSTLHSVTATTPIMTTDERQSAPTVSQETCNPQTTAPEPLGDATCCASSDFVSQTSENGSSSPGKNPSDASQLSQYSLAQRSRTSLLCFVQCPELWKSLGGSDISRRLKYAILRWLELGAPDPEFGHLTGYWSDWVPLFEGWLDSISAQQNTQHDESNAFPLSGKGYQLTNGQLTLTLFFAVLGKDNEDVGVNLKMAIKTASSPFTQEGINAAIEIGEREGFRGHALRAITPEEYE